MIRKSNARDSPPANGREIRHRDDSARSRSWKRKPLSTNCFAPRFLLRSFHYFSGSVSTKILFVQKEKKKKKIEQLFQFVAALILTSWHPNICIKYTGEVRHSGSAWKVPRNCRVSQLRDAEVSQASTIYRDFYSRWPRTCSSFHVLVTIRDSFCYFKHSSK